MLQAIVDWLVVQIQSGATDINFGRAGRTRESKSIRRTDCRTAKRHYINPEAAQELAAFQVAAQAAAHAQAATEAYRRAATAVAAAMGISRTTPKELDRTSQGCFCVEEEAAQRRGAPEVGQVDADLLGV